MSRTGQNKEIVLASGRRGRTRRASLKSSELSVMEAGDHRKCLQKPVSSLAPLAKTIPANSGGFLD